MTANHIQTRRSPLPVIVYTVYPYFPGHSLRRASKSLGLTMSRSHVSIWRWVQRLGPVLGSFGADPGDFHHIFVDETMVNVGGAPALIWVAFEPDLRAMLDFHVSWRGNFIDAYLFIRRPVHKYGRVPIYTDGAGWYADACRWAGVEHVVYGRPLRNLMERVVQYVKDRTEAFDDPFPVGERRLESGRAFEHVLNWLSAFMFMHDFMLENGGLAQAPARVEGGRAVLAERAASDFLARVGGELKVTEPFKGTCFIKPTPLSGPLHPAGRVQSPGHLLLICIGFTFIADRAEGSPRIYVHRSA